MPRTTIGWVLEISRESPEPVGNPCQGTITSTAQKRCLVFRENPTVLSHELSGSCPLLLVLTVGNADKSPALSSVHAPLGCNSSIPERTHLEKQSPACQLEEPLETDRLLQHTPAPHSPSATPKGLTRGQARPGTAVRPQGRLAAGLGAPVGLQLRGAPQGWLFTRARCCGWRKLRGRGVDGEGLSELPDQALHAVCGGRDSAQPTPGIGPGEAARHSPLCVSFMGVRDMPGVGERGSAS